MRKWSVLIAVLLGLLALPAVVAAHPERETHYPDYTKGKVPSGPATGKTIYVCKSDSGSRLRTIFRSRPRTLKTRLRQLKTCRIRHIQQAVDVAATNDRIRVFPGVYREEPSRAVPFNDPKCSRQDARYWEDTNDGHGEDGKVPTYDFHADCKNSRNLIQVLGDSTKDDDRVCDMKCNLRIGGIGRVARDVVIIGDRVKRDVIRVDRADGFLIRNLTTEQASFNGVDVVETNGFLIRAVTSRFNQNYGVLTFTSDNGLYDNVEAYGNGDSGIYPGSGPEGRCQRYGIEIKNVRSYGNVLGLSGTAGNGTWTHDSSFNDNAAGMINDSFVPGHPGMPQDCSKWTNNKIDDNNKNPFVPERQEYCAETPFKDRPRELLCPQFQVPVGTGIGGYGINQTIVENNQIYDNWRQGIGLFWVPAVVRGEDDPAKQSDTSNGNRFANNTFGVGPGGVSRPNGIDVYWDEQGIGNCWEGNVSGPSRHAITSDPKTLPTCASGGSTSTVSNPLKSAFEVPCATWDPETNQDPPGCSWFKTPPKPAPEG